MTDHTHDPDMDQLKSILVDVDASAPAHPALERATRIARACGARLTITDVIAAPGYPRSHLPPDVEEEMLQRRRSQLAEVARRVTGIEVDTRLLVGRPGTVLIQEVMRAGHDLLMRSHARDSAGPASRPFGAVDMELVRKCPCPVLLVRHGPPASHPRIVAAVNPATDDAGERALNVRIVEAALLMARCTEGIPVLLHAWSPFAERMLRSQFTADVLASYVEEERQRVAADLEELAKSVGDRLSGVPVEQRRGEPEDVITDFVVAERVDLVVVGSVARSGLAGVLIGNTAERILRKVPCSVLTVKPEGFVSPVRSAGN